MAKRKGLDSMRSVRWRRLADRKDTVVTSMVLPIALHRRLGLAAVRLHWPVAEVVRVAVAEWLDTHGAEQ